jgi:oxygen-independent coproporphyrinogen-3 oxidase
MAGIYIHIPFCKKACHYCNFHFSTQVKYIEPLNKALLKEIELQKNYLQDPIKTIYIGGGTPSLISLHDIEKLIRQLRLHFQLSNEIEFTLEANPDDIDLVKVQNWKNLGINRLSIGIQSFQQKALDWMNRAHTTQQSHKAIQAAIQGGISNISADLIYGTPHLSDEDLMTDLNELTQYAIPHISCYALTVEEKTALHIMIQQQKMEAIDVEKQARHFEIVVDTLEKNGMEQYEISNFSQPNYRSKHNSNYWNGIPYLGLGPSAHSFNKISRQWNVANNALYLKSIEDNKVPFEMEELSLATRYNEYMMTSLRCMEGFDNQYIETSFGKDFLEHTMTVLGPMLEKEFLTPTLKGYTITKKSKFLADGIASDFFWI